MEPLLETGPTHKQLCSRAVQWLRGSMGCGVVLSGISSTSEIPDAIGWSTNWKRRGSIVVECKTSVSDFYRDKHKGRGWHGQREPVAKMGRYRYFLVPKGLIEVEKLQERHPDHGLLYVHGRRVLIAREAPRREDCNLDQEIRLLHFSLVHLQENFAIAGFRLDLCEVTKHFLRADLSSLMPTDAVDVCKLRYAQRVRDAAKKAH